MHSEGFRFKPEPQTLRTPFPESPITFNYEVFSVDCQVFPFFFGGGGGGGGIGLSDALWVKCQGIRGQVFARCGICAQVVIHPLGDVASPQPTSSGSVPVCLPHTFPWTVPTDCRSLVVHRGCRCRYRGRSDIVGNRGARVCLYIQIYIHTYIYIDIEAVSLRP